MLSNLLPLGWEFDPKTNGFHFAMLTSEEDGLGMDAFIREFNDVKQVQVFHYDFFLGGQGPEIEPRANTFMDPKHLEALTWNVLQKGWEPLSF